MLTHPRRLTRLPAIAAFLTLGAFGALGAFGPAAGSPAQAAAGTETPASLRAEHEAIHAALEQVTQAPGATGAAARALAQVLHPHFERENEIALPPLGALAPLARGETPPDADAILKMTSALEQELPRMLEEHKQIRAAVEKLAAAARADGEARAAQLAEELAAHARTEEEVLYPAAIVVGKLLGTRMRGN